MRFSTNQDRVQAFTGLPRNPNKPEAHDESYPEPEFGRDRVTEFFCCGGNEQR